MKELRAINILTSYGHTFRLARELPTGYALFVDEIPNTPFTSYKLKTGQKLYHKWNQENKMAGTNVSSGLQTADAVVTDRRSILAGIHMVTGGTNDCTVIVYDNASAASGLELFKMVVTGADDGRYFEMPQDGVRAKNGLYVDITTAGGGAYIVHYR